MRKLPWLFGMILIAVVASDFLHPSAFGHYARPRHHALIIALMVCIFGSAYRQRQD